MSPVTPPADHDRHDDRDPNGDRRADPMDETRAALVAALVELERHCGEIGWDRPPRLFALVPTVDVVSDEPELAAHLGLSADGPEGALTAIEQDDFDPGEDVVAALSAISWPPAVHGCAVALERSFLPASAEADIPSDPEQAQRYVHEHPERHDIRLVVGATRDGVQHGVGRLLSAPEDLLGGPELAPGVASLLTTTLS